MIARLQSERGVTLLETVVAAAILGSALVVFLAGLSGGLLATSQSDRLSTAHELARSQIEYVKTLPYVAPPTSYGVIATPSGYTLTAVAVSAENGDANVEQVNVDVSKDGAVVYHLEALKVNR